MLVLLVLLRKLLLQGLVLHLESDAVFVSVGAILQSSFALSFKLPSLLIVLLLETQVHLLELFALVIEHVHPREKFFTFDCQV